MADLTPYDPHALFATGGDATPISSTLPITFTSSGGGIFVFQNDTGADLASLEVDVQVRNALAQNGFVVTGTIVVPPGSSQQASFSAGFIPASNCTGFSATTFCEQMTFALVPGPLVPKGGNFVLDFDDPNQYTEEDRQILAGTYTGTGDTTSNAHGSWGPLTQGSVTPFTAVPEPQHYAGLLAGMLALAVYSRSRRS
jgi:hypothetical protein